MLRLLSLPLGALLASAAAPVAQEDNDSLFLRDGNTEMGKVLEEGFAGISFQPERGAKKTVAWADVRSIEYFDAPEELRGAVAALAAGNPGAALELLQSVPAEVRPFLQQQVLFHTAFAEERLDQVDEAMRHYQELLDKAPKGRYLRLASENLVQLHLGKGDAAGARAVLTKVGEGAKDLPGADAVIGLLEARILEHEGKHAEARERFAAVEALAGADPEVVEEAKLGRARTLLAENKGAEAEPLLRGLITDSKSARVQSGAWNGIGEIQTREGRAKKEADRILEGSYAYLRTVVQYKPLPGESTEEYERALSGAATCFQFLSELEQNSEKKKLLRERHRERLDQLQREFPRSNFLPKK